MNNINTTFAKKDIQNRFNISLATVNNWIKTGVIPSPENGYYTKDVYSNLVKSIENNKGKLQSRANRSHLNTSNIIFLGIKEKKRKELLLELIEEFKKNDIQIIKSTNPGKSYCNQVYWNSLNYIKDNSLNCKILFVHVPFEKNIENIADFAEKIKKSIHLYMKSIYL